VSGASVEMNIRFVSLQLMRGREKPHMVKYKVNTDDWNYDASCTLTSLPVWDLKNFKCLVFVVQSVQHNETCVLCLALFTTSHFH
jgi:hypothetical protein